MMNIYHYCSAEAFIHILQTGRLWASDARRTNDRRELDVFKGLAFAHIEELAKQDSAIQTFASQLDFHIEAVEDMSEYYVCCFSEDSDSVSQWVAYADRGTGFAIGFDVNAVRMAIGASQLDLSYRELAMGVPPRRWLFGPVVYDEKKIAALLDDVSKLVNNAIQLGTGPTRDYIDRLSAFCKDRSFDSEKEWRIAYNSSQTLTERLVFDAEATGEKPREFWRHGRYGLTPYVLTPDLRSCIREVVIGPSNKDSRPSTHVHRFLEAIDLPCDVRHSKSPYR